MSATSTSSSSSSSMASRRRSRPLRRASTVTAKASGAGGAGGTGEDEPRQRVSDEELRAAVRECRELLEEATRLANEQARAELAASFLKTPEGGAGLTGNLAVDMARVQLFFRGKGMRPWEAEKVSQTLVELDSIYEDVELLAVKYDRLVRTLPDVDVAAMVANDPVVMNTEVPANIERMLLMFELFPVSKEKVFRMIAEVPKLLYCVDLAGRLRRTCECIKRVYSKETDEGCLYAVRLSTSPTRAVSCHLPFLSSCMNAINISVHALIICIRIMSQVTEEPGLLFDLPDLKIFEKEVRVDIAELPMTVQEMLVYATRNEHE